MECNAIHIHTYDVYTKCLMVPLSEKSVVECVEFKGFIFIWLEDITTKFLPFELANCVVLTLI